MSKKNGLDMLQQEVEIPEIVQMRAQDAFDQIHREAKLAENGVVRISEARREETTMNKKKGKKTKRTLVVAVLTAVLVLGTMTVAVAAFRGSLTEGLRNMFHISEDQEEDLLNREDGLVQIIETEGIPETTALPLEEETELSETVAETTEKEQGLFEREGDITSVTCNGVTVTLVQAMVDRYHVNLSLRVEGLGEANNERMGFGRIQMYIGENRAGTYGGGIGVVEEDYVEYTFTIRPTDRYNEGPGWFFGKQLELNLTDIRVLVSKDDGTKTVLEGEWNLKWTMQGTEEVHIFTVDHELEPEIIVKEVELTPISLVVRYEFPRQVVQEQTENGGIANLIKDPPYFSRVILKDGTICEYITGGMGKDGYVQGSTTEYVSIRKLSALIDPTDIDSLIFQDWNTKEEYIVPLYE